MYRLSTCPRQNYSSSLQKHNTTQRKTFITMDKVKDTMRKGFEQATKINEERMSFLVSLSRFSSD